MHRLELLEQLHDEDRDALLKVVDNYLTTAQLHSTSKNPKMHKRKSHSGEWLLFNDQYRLLLSKTNNFHHFQI